MGPRRAKLEEIIADANAKFGEPRNIVERFERAGFQAWMRALADAHDDGATPEQIVDGGFGMLEGVVNGFAQYANGDRDGANLQKNRELIASKLRAVICKPVTDALRELFTDMAKARH